MTNNNEFPDEVIVAQAQDGAADSDEEELIAESDDDEEENIIVEDAARPPDIPENEELVDDTADPPSPELRRDSSLGLASLNNLFVGAMAGAGMAASVAGSVGSAVVRGATSVTQTSRKSFARTAVTLEYDPDSKVFNEVIRATDETQQEILLKSHKTLRRLRNTAKGQRKVLQQYANKKTDRTKKASNYYRQWQNELLAIQAIECLEKNAEKALVMTDGKIEQVMTQVKIVEDCQAGILNFYEFSTCDQLQKATGFENEDAFEKPTNNGYAGFLRELDRCGWGESPHCPVPGFATSRRMIGRNTECKESFKAYAKAVVGFPSVGRIPAPFIVRPRSSNPEEAPPNVQVQPEAPPEAPPQVPALDPATIQFFRSNPEYAERYFGKRGRETDETNTTTEGAGDEPPSKRARTTGPAENG